MQSALLFALALPVSCFLSPTQAVQRSPAQRDLFPTPKEGLKLPAATAESAMTLAELTNEFSRVTGETLLVDAQIRPLVQATAVGLNRALEVPAAEVYFVVETLLVQNGLYFARLNEREPRMLALYSSTGSDKHVPRANTVHVPVESIDMWARHPAFVVTTSIDLPNTDVRTLSNAMRTLFADGNIQQMVPAGVTNTLIITGFGPEVASLVGTLREVDAASAKENERRAKAEAEKPAPKSNAPPEKAKD